MLSEPAVSPDSAESATGLSVAAQKRATYSIALASGLCNTAFNFYWPFLPLYLLEIGAKNEDFRKHWESVKAFRADQYLWLQLADNTYDTYMMIQQRKKTL